MGLKKLLTTEMPSISKSPPKKTGDWSLDGKNWHRAIGKGLPPRASGQAIELSP